VKPRFEPERGGGFRLRLPADEREMLRSVPELLRELLDGDLDAPDLRRLFPPAYQDDADLQTEYRRLTIDDLADRRREALRVVEDTIDADHLTEEQLVAWLGVVNDVRLVLGTRLDVSEDASVRPPPRDDPRFAQFALFSYMGFLEENIVEALAKTLPPVS
jgi:Domain of unknown function (DUF2017)